MLKGQLRARLGALLPAERAPESTHFTPVSGGRLLKLLSVDVLKGEYNIVTLIKAAKKKFKKVCAIKVQISKFCSVCLHE